MLFFWFDLQQKIGVRNIHNSEYKILNKTGYDADRAFANVVLQKNNMWFAGLFMIATLGMMACLTVDLYFSFNNPFKPQKDRLYYYVAFIVALVLFMMVNDKMTSLLSLDRNFFK